MTTISLVTGASRGLGRNTAISIAHRGGDVILTYRNGAEETKAVVAEIEAMGRKAVAIQLDVTSILAFSAFVDSVRSTLRDSWSRDTFDHLVNNAGQGELASFAETTEAQFDALFDTHVKGVFFLTQALLPLLADGGRIVNFSSGLTRVSFEGFAAYSAAKGAVEVLSIYMAKELGARGIAVNTVAPGAIETDFLGGGARHARSQQAVRKHDGARSRRHSRRHWADDRQPARPGQSLGQRAAHRSVGRSDHLTRTGRSRSRRIIRRKGRR